MLYDNKIRYFLLLFYLLKFTSKSYRKVYVKTKLVRIGGGADQRRLLKTLFEDNKYDLLERPVFNDTDTLPVSMSLALQQIIDFVSLLNYKNIFKFYSIG
jgi:hypothetical protein